MTIAWRQVCSQIPEGPVAYQIKKTTSGKGNKQSTTDTQTVVCPVTNCNKN